MSIIGCANCGGTHYGSNECPYLEKNMGEPCAVCGERTSYCCSDCAIDGAVKVYVCIADACRTQHEKKHSRAACPMSAPKREALVKALRGYSLCEPTCDAARCKSYCVYAAASQAADMIEALSSPAVTVTEDARKSERDAVLEEAAKVADEHSSPPFGHDHPMAVKFWHLGEAYAREEIAKAIRALKSTTPQTGSV